jgi:hypothetical protein
MDKVGRLVVVVRCAILVLRRVQAIKRATPLILVRLCRLIITGQGERDAFRRVC